MLLFTDQPNYDRVHGWLADELPRNQRRLGFDSCPDRTRGMPCPLVEWSLTLFRQPHAGSAWQWWLKRWWGRWGEEWIVGKGISVSTYLAFFWTGRLVIFAHTLTTHQHAVLPKHLVGSPTSSEVVCICMRVRKKGLCDSLPKSVALHGSISWKEKGAGWRCVSVMYHPNVVQCYLPPECCSVLFTTRMLFSVMYHPNVVQCYLPPECCSVLFTTQMLFSVIYHPNVQCYLPSECCSGSSNWTYGQLYLNKPERKMRQR